jgi:hypothetical protein
MRLWRDSWALTLGLTVSNDNVIITVVHGAHRRDTQMNALEKSNGRVTKLNIKAPKITPHPDTVDVQTIEKQIIVCRLVGLSQLIVNNFNEKSVNEMEDLRRLDTEGRRAQKKAPRPPVIPEERYMRARCLDDQERDCVPAHYIKAALVTAATKYKEIGVAGTVVRGALFVLGELLPIEHRGVKPWPELKAQFPDLKVGKMGLPAMRRDVVRVGSFPSKQPDLRYRPCYTDWSLSIQIEFEPSLISLAGLHHLIRRAGSSVGLCEWRPEKSPGGTFGRFDIAAGVEAVSR